MDRSTTSGIRERETIIMNPSKHVDMSFRPRHQPILSSASASTPAHRVEFSVGSPGLSLNAPKFASQPLRTLESAVAPWMPKPIVPFETNTRKRAFASAAYYSECCMNGISPVEADSAALAVESQYNKWWLASKYHGPDGKIPVRKKRKLQSRAHQSLEPPYRADEHDACLISEEEASISHRGVMSDSGESFNIREVAVNARVRANEIYSAKAALTAELSSNGGDTTTAKFASHLEILHTSYSSRGWDARWIREDTTPFCMDGTWLSLSKPTFSECQGRTEKGQYSYSLGRLSFDMFRPTNLVCSVQGVFNSISVVDTSAKGHTFGSVPSRLQQAVRKPGKPPVRNYDIVVAFTVDANQSRRGTPATEGDPEYVVTRPIASLLTNHGYCVPDPDVPNRLSIWFSGGSLEVQNEEDDLAEWKQLFDEKEAPRRAIGEIARVLAAKCLLGATMASEMADDGKLSYSLKRPIGGHGQVFCDVLYADDTMRILRGHHGTTFVFSKVPSFSNESSTE